MKKVIFFFHSVPVVKPVRYVFAMMLVVGRHDFRRRGDVNVSDPVGVPRGTVVGDRMERFQQRPRLDHFQELNDFLKTGGKNPKK